LGTRWMNPLETFSSLLLACSFKVRKKPRSIKLVLHEIVQEAHRTWTARVGVLNAAAFGFTPIVRKVSDGLTAISGSARARTHSNFTVAWSLVHFYSWQKWGELIAKACTKSSLTPVFEKEGSISSGLRSSFAESLDQVQINAENSDTSRTSEIQLPETGSWVMNPYVAGSSDELPALKWSPSDVFCLRYYLFLYPASVSRHVGLNQCTMENNRTRS
jgi:hypothetical protein